MCLVPAEMSPSQPSDPAAASGRPGPESHGQKLRCFSELVLLVVVLRLKANWCHMLSWRMRIENEGMSGREEEWRQHPHLPDS